MDRFSYNGPIVDRLEAKAGLLKGASEYNRIDQVSEKLFNAVAAAQKITGAPISTHTEHGTCGLEQVELLVGQGINPNKVIICHLDRNPDLEYHMAVADSGVYLEYDNVGRIKYWPDSVIIDLIVKMVENGYEDQILLGTDYALRSYWKAYGGGPGMVYLVEQFIPKLKKRGLDEAVIEKFMVKNPARAFAFEKVEGR